MSQPNSNVEDVQTKWMASLISHGIEAGYTMEDDLFKQLFASAIMLETEAQTAMYQTAPLVAGGKYEQAIKELTQLIDNGERLFAQHPRTLAEEAYGYALARLYFLRAAVRSAAGGQSGDSTSQLQRALSDANKALSYPSKYYEAKDPVFLSEVRKARDVIQAELKQAQQANTYPFSLESSSTSRSTKMLADARQLETKVEDIKAEMNREANGGNPVIVEILATSGIETIQAFFDRYADELKRESGVKDILGAYLVTFRATRGAARLDIANTSRGSDRKERLDAAKADIDETLGYPSSYFNNPQLKPQLRELQSSIREAQNKKDGCFIATAAYGSPLAPEIVVLQRFRETQLRPYRTGRWMIGVYERYSPPLANAIAPHPTARLWVRRLLLAPVITAIQRWFP